MTLRQLSEPTGGSFPQPKRVAVVATPMAEIASHAGLLSNPAFDNQLSVDTTVVVAVLDDRLEFAVECYGSSRDDPAATHLYASTGDWSVEDLDQVLGALGVSNRDVIRRFI